MEARKKGGSPRKAPRVTQSQGRKELIDATELAQRMCRAQNIKEVSVADVPHALPHDHSRGGAGGWAGEEAEHAEEQTARPHTAEHLRASSTGGVTLNKATSVHPGLPRPGLPEAPVGGQESLTAGAAERRRCPAQVQRCHADPNCFGCSSQRHASGEMLLFVGGRCDAGDVAVVRTSAGHMVA